MMRKLKSCSGQSTVEFAITFPALMIVAVIAINACLFLGDCAAFDRVARQSVRVVATSPAYGQSVGMSISQIQSMLDVSFDRSNLQSSVSANGTSEGFVTFTATLDFSPTLFGLGLKQEVFGVALPHLSHSVDMTVSTYKPGVFM